MFTEFINKVKSWRVDDTPVINNSTADLLVFLRQVNSSYHPQPGMQHPLHEMFERHDVEKYNINALVEEICLDGGNTITNIARGLGIKSIDDLKSIDEIKDTLNHAYNEGNIAKISQGVPYETVVVNVAKQLKIDTDKPLRNIEEMIAFVTIQKYVETMSERDRAEIMANFKNHKDHVMKDISDNNMSQVVINGLKSGGIVFILSRMIPVVNVALVPAMLAGPAYRKIIPTVIEISLMRCYQST